MGDQMRILFATGNRGKLSEARARLAPIGIEVESLSAVAPELELVEPQAATLEEVCRSKLEQALSHARAAGFGPDEVDAVMVEDAGLFVDALGGFPGVYSAHAFETVGWGGILRLLADDGLTRTASFHCVAGVASDSVVRLHHGTCTGMIATDGRGEGGFGFDPIFVPDGDERTFAEMTTTEKGEVSHRGRALDALIADLAR